MSWIVELEKSIPVLAEVDVLVCGGGPAGIAAALSAARSGAQTMLVEQSGFFGGQGTTGLICYFAPGWHDGERPIIGGVWDEVQQGLRRRGAIFAGPSWSPYDPDEYKVLAFDLLTAAGVRFQVHTTVAAVLGEGERIDAVVVESKSGRQAIRARVFIDATGDGDLGWHSGAGYELGRPEDGAMQPPTMMFAVGGADLTRAQAAYPKARRVDADGQEFFALSGLRNEVAAALAEGLVTIPRDHVSAVFELPNKPGVVGVNYGRITNFDSTNAADLTRGEIVGRAQVAEAVAFLQKYVAGFENAFLMFTGPRLGIREGRRLRGDYWMTGEDIDAGAQFDDVVSQGCYGLDIHSPDSISTVLTHLPEGTHYDIPYRSLRVAGKANLLAAGRTISASHEAMSAFRVQPICMGIGQAAGVAAVLAAQTNDTRTVEVPELQRRLEVQGAILR